MRRLANGTQVNSLPVPAAAIGTPGFGTNGNPAAGQEASIFDADQYNRIQEEIVNFVLAGGLTLDGSGMQNSQMVTALFALFPGLAANGRSLTNPGYIRLPGGLILQWCRNLTALTNSSGGSTIPFVYPVAFNTAVLGHAFVVSQEAAATGAQTCVANAPTLTQATVNITVLNNPQAGLFTGMSGIVLGI